jgi:hypothetical protein
VNCGVALPSERTSGGPPRLSPSPSCHRSAGSFRRWSGQAGAPAECDSRRFAQSPSGSRPWLRAGASTAGTRTRVQRPRAAGHAPTPRSGALLTLPLHDYGRGALIRTYSEQRRSGAAGWRGHGERGRARNGPDAVVTRHRATASGHGALPDLRAARLPRPRPERRAFSRADRRWTAPSPARPRLPRRAAPRARSLLDPPASARPGGRRGAGPVRPHPPPRGDHLPCDGAAGKQLTSRCTPRDQRWSRARADGPRPDSRRLAPARPAPPSRSPPGAPRSCPRRWCSCSA